MRASKDALPACPQSDEEPAQQGGSGSGESREQGDVQPKQAAAAAGETQDAPAADNIVPLTPKREREPPLATRSMVRPRTSGPTHDMHE